MKVKINNEVLIWAREELNISQEEAARRIGKGIEDIKKWEKGEDFPTYAQLESLAYNVYKRPMAVFFFPENPQLPKQERKFRTLDNEVFSEIPTKILELINKARTMQINLEELESEAKLRITQLKLNPDGNNLCDELRSFLGINLEMQKKAKNMSDAFEMWRTAFYECGIYVFKDAFKEQAFSGFCLYDEKYPVIYINNSMSYSRQIFTLFHELYHILLETSGIDKTVDDYISRLEDNNKKIEIACNAFAGKFLVPNEDITIKIKDKELNDKNIEMLANEYSVSRDVILRKLLDLGIITKTLYELKHKEYSNEIFRNPNNNGGGNYYNSKKSYLGENYITDVCKNYYNGKIDIYETANYLNVKVEAIPQLGILIKEGSR